MDSARDLLKNKLKLMNPSHQHKKKKKHKQGKGHVYRDMFSVIKAANYYLFNPKINAKESMECCIKD